MAQGPGPASAGSGPFSVRRGCVSREPCFAGATMRTLFRSLLLLAASATLGLAAGEGWLTDWEAAKAKAKAENKPILLNLVGSDWCGWCKKLEKDVLSQQAFKDFAAKHLILVEADFPKNQAQDPALKKQNAALEKQYLNGGYPTMYLLDAEGKKLSGDLGELDGGLQAYLAKLKELVAKPRP